MTFRSYLMRMGCGERDEKMTPGTCSLPPAPLGDFSCDQRGEFFAVVPVLEGDGMKALLAPADIHPDDDGTRLVVSHSDSRGRINSRYHFFI